MKPTKRRIDIRLKKSLFERITTISDQLEKTWTDVIEEALAYGLKWYEAKIKREIQTSTNSETPVVQENNKPTQPSVEEEETITDEQVDGILKKFYGQKEQKSELQPVEVEKPKEAKKEEVLQEGPRYNENGEELW